MNNGHPLFPITRRFGLLAVMTSTLLVGRAATGHTDTPQPKADPKAVVVCGGARFTVLTPQMIRVEYSAASRFEDRPTFTVVNRRLPVPQYTRTEDDTCLYITTSHLRLRYRKGTDPRTTPASPAHLSVTVATRGTTTEWYPGKPDPLNLKGTCRTLDGCPGQSWRSNMEDGVVSRSGWAAIDDAWSHLRADGSRSLALAHNEATGYDWWTERADTTAMDTYLLGYGDDYRQAVTDYTRIAGRIPLPPDYVFGYWYSKYSSYSADDYRAIMSDLETNRIPADVMILDMDWHWNGQASSLSEGRGGWTGWSWNYNLLPDPRGLLSEMHGRGLHTALNLHPADGVDSTESPRYFSAMKTDLGGRYLTDSGRRIAWAMDYPDFTTSLFTRILREHEAEGVDFWWMDWQQHLTSHFTPALGETFWCNHVFYNEAAKRTDRRPLIFHRWGGMGSHRYQIGFSGDALISYDALDFEPYFTATASNVGYGYWGHDLGGHAFTTEETVNDPDLVLRWIQFGVFTPIFRTHATNDPRIERRMWHFPNFPKMREAVRLRYSLFPYIYTMARKTYDTGISICRPLYYDYPEAEEAYTYDNEYFFGDDILVAPITSKPDADRLTRKTVWLPEGQWWSASTGETIAGPCERTMTFTDRQIPYFIRQGAVIPCLPDTVMHVTARPAHMILQAVAGADGSASLYEDDGDNADYATRYATTALTQKQGRGRTVYTIAARQGVSAKAPARRSYTLQILGNARPLSATVDGKTVSVAFDADKHCATVEIPEADCSKARRIVVRYAK